MYAGIEPHDANARGFTLQTMAEAMALLASVAEPDDREVVDVDGVRVAVGRPCASDLVHIACSPVVTLADRHGDLDKLPAAVLRDGDGVVVAPAVIERAKRRRAA